LTPPIISAEHLGPEAARFTLRSAGYCVLCDRIVEVGNSGACPKGHPAEAVSAVVALGPDEAVPSLPRFNFAAFALPPVWGPAHGQWVGVIFLPIWIFADNVASTLGRGNIAVAGALVVLPATVAFQAYFAKRANGLAWRRVAGRRSLNEFVRKERLWALACVPIGVALLGWALYYRLVLS
jgi:hypothetical protein